MSDKPKRTRRTKAQMIAFRSERQIVDLKPEEREPIESVGEPTIIPLAGKYDIVNAISDDDLKDGYVEGWITINRALPSQYSKEWIYCGGDVHETEEKARKVTAPNKIGVAKIRFKVR